MTIGSPSGSGAPLKFDGQEQIPNLNFINSINITNDVGQPYNIEFNDNGSVMYIVDGGNSQILQYNLSENFDVTTLNLNGSFDTSNEDGGPRAVGFNDDGSKMFVVGTFQEKIFEYGLSTNFDVTTATLNDSFSFTENVVTGYHIKPNGSKMFIVGSNNIVKQYTLTTAFDVSTASKTDSFDVSNQSTNTTGLAFSNDGKKMYVGEDNGTIFQYYLVNKFDLSVVGFRYSEDISDITIRNNGLKYNTDGSALCAVDRQANIILQWAVGTVVGDTL